MEGKNILVDIDSTTFDTHGLSLQLTNEHFGTKYTSEDIDDWHDPKNVPIEHTVWRWGDECFGNPDFDRRLSPMPDAERVIKELRHAGHVIIFVTDRPIRMWDMTRDLLDRHGFEDYGMIFCESTGLNKTELCELLGLEVVIEDSPKHAIRSAQAAFVDRVFLFDYTYNRDVQLDKVQRVKTWKEIEEALCV